MRARGSSVPHLLQLVISDEPFTVNIDFKAPLEKSDHCVILIQCQINPSCKQSLKKYAFSKGDNTGLRQSLQSVLWEDLFSVHIDNIDDMWQVLKNELQNKINKPKTNSFQQLKKDFWNYPLPPNVRACLLYTSDAADE